MDRSLRWHAQIESAFSLNSLLKLNVGYLNDKGKEMNEHTPMKHGTLSITRQINAPRELVYEAWTKTEHRKHWFVGPAWTEIERSVDLKVNGQEIAHGRFEDGTVTIYTACASDLCV
jgi:hypothetical protein